MPATKAQLDAARAQEQEAEAGDGYVLVPLAGHDGVTKDVRTLPAGKWRASALRCLNTGDIDGFMKSVLHEDDFDTFVDLDPDTEGFGKFTEDAARLSGGDLGKSSGRSRSGNGTRRS
ncbi:MULTISPECIES: hypothetical protein [unclassified Streptomyces]|uniref:hypothetical protein n=1 Tax=unclassified Streptomyces TaxID=2593676 RepID=UPI00278C372C|nr:MULTISPECIES: hypothetical protein [unclassified Streptomyces]